MQTLNNLAHNALTTIIWAGSRRKMPNQEGGRRSCFLGGLLMVMLAFRKFHCIGKLLCYNKKTF